MAYTINLTDGTVFATITDGTYNQSSSVTLVGKNYAGYGEFLDENFIQMLENFANTTAPSAPLTGQLWWDKTNSLLKVYNGTAFKTISLSVASSSTPTSNVTGDLWYDTTNQQVKVYTGSSWIVVGPAYSSSQGTTGAIPETILDNSATPHYVTTLYSNSIRVAIFSSDANFTAAAPVSTLFPTVYKGVTFSNSSGTNMAGNIISGSNVVITAGGNTTTTITSTGANITGYANITGNLNAANFTTAGNVSVTGNITGANIIGTIAAGSNTITTTGNITGGNIRGIIAAGSNTITTTGNITGGNLLFGTGVVSGSGNITGGNIFTANANILSSGNINAVNIITANANILGAAGTISATGNITGNYYFGNGSQLTGLSAAVSVSQIQNGTSNVRIATTDGSVTMGVGGTANVVVVDTSTLYVTNANVGNITKSGSNNAGNIGGATSFFGTTYSNALQVNNIVHVGTNAVGNIGSSSSYFNQVFATATTALYADVAERFHADEVLEPGTVVELGGVAEITRSLTELSDNVFGVISTKPAYTMNGGAGEDDTHPKVAMTGRVPVKVTGCIKKGDRLVSAGNGLARSAAPGEATAFNTIGRALVDKITPESGTIEAIVTIKN